MRFLHLLSLLLVLPLAASAQTAPPVECPKIEVTGPAGQIYAGEIAIFTVNANLDVKGLKFHWTVSAGTITAGQGKPWIEVQSDPKSSDSHIVATVEVAGLPDGCKNLASETAGIKRTGDPPVLDEYERVSVKEELERLDLVAAEWKKYQHWYLYFILYLAPKDTGTSVEARIKRIKDYLTKKYKIPEERLIFVNGGRLRALTRIYRVPPGADNPPICDACESTVESLPTTGDLYVTDEWGELSIEDELGRLDLLWVEWRKRASHYLYFYIYRGPAESSASEQARIKRIRDHLIGKRKIPSDHVVIFGGGTAPHPVTQIYTLPPHARQYMPTRPI